MVLVGGQAATFGEVNEIVGEFAYAGIALVGLAAVGSVVNVD